MKQEVSFNFAPFFASLIINGCIAVLALSIGKGQIAFVLFSIVFMYFGRRLGWWLSKVSLYWHPLPVILVECAIWGGLIAFVVHALITWHQPYWILKWIFGFGTGSYVSIPNYGLVMESSIPDRAYPRHFTISNLPFAVFVICSILFAYKL